MSCAFEARTCRETVACVRLFVVVTSTCSGPFAAAFATSAADDGLLGGAPAEADEPIAKAISSSNGARTRKRRERGSMVRLLS